MIEILRLEFIAKERKILEVNIEEKENKSFVEGIINFEGTCFRVFGNHVAFRERVSFAVFMTIRLFEFAGVDTTLKKRRKCTCLCSNPCSKQARSDSQIATSIKV